MLLKSVFLFIFFSTTLACGYKDCDCSQINESYVPFQCNNVLCQRPAGIELATCHNSLDCNKGLHCIRLSGLDTRICQTLRPVAYKGPRRCSPQGLECIRNNDCCCGACMKLTPVGIFSLGIVASPIRPCFIPKVALFDLLAWRIRSESAQRPLQEEVPHDQSTFHRQSRRVYAITFMVK